MKILMVCLGNICRSPLAEGIFKARAERYGLHSVKVDSAGLLSYHAGEQPDRRAMETALRHGIDISNQRARQFRLSDFDDFDLIFAMDDTIYEDLKKMAVKADHRNKIHLFLEFARFPAGSIVPDPYYGTMSDFENCFRMIDSASELIAKRLFNSSDPVR